MYVVLEEWLASKESLPTELTLGIKVHYRIGVLCHLHYFPTTGDNLDQENRATAFSFRNLSGLGWGHGQYSQFFLASIISAHFFQVGFGFVQNWVVLVPLRLLLGLFEAGYFPGVVYLISTWYSRYDMQKRYAAFYSLGLVASGCSGILAYGLQQMVCPLPRHWYSVQQLRDLSTVLVVWRAGDGSSLFLA